MPVQSQRIRRPARGPAAHAAVENGPLSPFRGSPFKFETLGTQSNSLVEYVSTCIRAPEWQGSLVPGHCACSLHPTMLGSANDAPRVGDLRPREYPAVAFSGRPTSVDTRLPREGNGILPDASMQRYQHPAWCARAGAGLAWGARTPRGPRARAPLSGQRGASAAGRLHEEYRRVPDFFSGPSAIEQRRGLACCTTQCSLPRAVLRPHYPPSRVNPASRGSQYRL